MTAQLLETPAAEGAGVAWELDELDARATLDAATRSVLVRRAAEVEEMRLTAHWAVLHGEPRDERDPMTQSGGDGTPKVREFCLAELAMARETHTATARALVADSLDLQHRLRRTWQVVADLRCEPWVARKVAVLSRNLTSEQVGVVDRAVAAAIAGHAPSTVLELAAAKVIEADPEAHAMRREAERHRRYVSLSRSDEFGYRLLIARIAAGDAAWLDAMIERVADILARERGHDHNREELRSLALGWLGRPAGVLKLLLEDTGTDQSEETDEHEPAQPAWAPAHLDRIIGRLAEMSTRQLAALRPRGVVHVHLTDEALRRQAGIARVEGGVNGGGPMLVQSLSELLGHADVKIQPVLDLAGRHRVDQYEIPDRIKDQAWQLAGGDCFPFSPRSATRTDPDFDHLVPYDPVGPPGQTGAHNCGPLRRRHHRWKTHGGYRCRQAGPGRYLWQTPHGLCYLVDPRGTRHLDPLDAEVMLTAPPGVEIYLAEPRLVLRLS